MLEFQRKRVWCYATVGMSAGDPGGLEVFLVTPEENPRAVEFLYSLAHFHRTGAPVGLGRTVNFGEELWAGSGWITASCEADMGRSPAKHIGPPGR